MKNRNSESGFIKGGVKPSRKMCKMVLTRGFFEGSNLLTLLLLLLLLILCHPPGIQARRKIDVFVAGFFPVSNSLSIFISYDY